MMKIILIMEHLLEFNLKKCDTCIGISYVVCSGRAELRWGHSDSGISLYMYKRCDNARMLRHHKNVQKRIIPST